MYLDTWSGAVSSITNFDTADKSSSKASKKLVSMIENAPQRAIVIGVTFDDPMKNLSKAAKKALASLGVDTAGVPYRGRFAFVAEKGRTELTQLVKSDSDIGTSVLKVRTSGKCSMTRLCVALKVRDHGACMLLH